MPGAKRRHVAPTHQDRQRHVMPRCQGAVVRERGKMSCADCPLATRHMAPLADLLEDLPAIGRTEGRRVENAACAGPRRRIEEGYGRHCKAKYDAGSKPARSGQI